ncbi:hypothetical protein [Streptomyces xanthochromogenes]|uniref:hypothetical protein n=1 Tax=Streptomyces xanthochromogenes TaxID=67384 RepID=UPI00342C7822
MVHSRLKALRWGIAHSDQSLSQSGHHGPWSLARSWEFPAAQDAWAFGYQVKLWVRGQGYPPAPSLETADPVHWQESASLDDLPLTQAVAWVNDLVHLMTSDQYSRDTEPASPGVLP